MTIISLSKGFCAEPLNRVVNGLPRMLLSLRFQEGSVLFGGQFFTDSLSLQNKSNALQLSGEA